MARERKLQIIKKKNKAGRPLIYARQTYTGLDGRRHAIWRRGDTVTEARENLQKALDEMKQHGEEAVTKARTRFDELADYFKDRYIKPAEYADGRKIAGMRSHVSLFYLLEPLKEHFGKAKLRNITHGMIEAYKIKRLQTITQYKKPRTIAAVNRELALLRRMFVIAHREGWILKNPFVAGDTLISLADERKRERIITLEEEDRLLAVCIGGRAHIRAILICALETAMRRGEIFTLTWRDVDLENRMIHIQAFHTKTLSARDVAITQRLYAELVRLYELSDKEPDTRIFGIESNIKRSWTAVRKLTGLEDVRLHDLRHTAITRWIQQGVPRELAGKLAGHTQAQTTMRYIHADKLTAKAAAAALDDMRK
jgi:integrase